MRIDKERELSNCSFVKVVLMFLVCFIHCTDFWTGTWFTVYPVAISSKALDLLSNWVGTFHVYTFIFVSGYIFHYVNSERHAYPDYWSFALKKAKRLIVPYLFTALVWVIPITQFYFHYDVKNLFVKYFLCTSPSQLWFLWTLFDIFIIAWPIANQNAILNSNIFVILLSISSIVLGRIGSILLPNVFCIWTALRYFPLFLLGMIYREREHLLLRKIPLPVYFTVDIILFVFYLQLQSQQSFISKLLVVLLEILLHYVGVLMLFQALQKIGTMLPDWKANKWFQFFAKRSLPIYLFHQQIVYCGIAMLNGHVPPLWNALICFVAAITISAGISSILLRYHITRFLIGESL